jgi:unsaturated rhamnogalacturonyl hydrolase
MENTRLLITCLLVSMIAAGFATTATLSRAQSQELPTKSEVAAAMQKVNDYWMSIHPDPAHNSWWHNGWSRSAYFTGDMAHYLMTGDVRYLNFARDWAERHNWQLNEGCYTTNADDQCAGQTYIALYKLNPVPSKISCITTSINNSETEDWWWIDAMYMAMPIYAELGVLYDDPTYFEMMYERYEDTKVRRGLYDTDEGLWYRDEGYKYPGNQTPNGEKIFWSRGNGWVFAAHARVLEVLPIDAPHRDEYIATFQAMAEALKAVQRPDGFWNVSLADPNDYPGPETSGTAFFTYGMAWGINNGYLASSGYGATVAKAWNAMVNTAVHPNGKLGYVQGVGQEPASSQPVTYDNTEDFGVGAFLLAGSEVYEMGNNLALNQPVTCSSEPEPENGCTNAVDGNLDNRWSASTFPQWIEVDLGAVYSVDRIRVHPYQNRAYRYYVEVKATSSGTYTTVVDRSGNTQSGLVIENTFPVTDARYVRLRVIGAHGYSGNWVSIREFEVFGSELALTLHGIPADQAIHLSWGVNVTLPVTSTWQIAYDGPAGDQPSPITDIVSSTHTYTLTGLTNYTWYTVTLNAMLDSTACLTDTVTVMPTDHLVYLPLVLRAY